MCKLSTYTKEAYKIINKTMGYNNFRDQIMTYGKALREKGKYTNFETRLLFDTFYALKHKIPDFHNLYERMRNEIDFNDGHLKSWLNEIMTSFNINVKLI